MMTRSRSLRCSETGLLRITALATAVAPGSRFSKANEVGEALIVFAVLVMAVVFVRRRRSGARARRRTQPPRTPVPAGGRDNYYATTGITTRGGLDPWTNDPSFSSGPDPRPNTDHPSFPGGPDPRWTTSQARNADIYGQLPVMVTDAPLRRQAAADLQVRPEHLPPYARVDASELGGPVRRQVEDLRSADSVRLANQILAEADNQAAATVAAAGQQAADMRRRASDQAVATLAAAEQQASELRAAVVKMSAELAAVAAYVTDKLAISTTPAVLPRPYATKELLGPADPVARPPARPAAKTAAMTATPARGWLSLKN
jgi:hypothetical protein